MFHLLRVFNCSQKQKTNNRQIRNLVRSLQGHCSKSRRVRSISFFLIQFENATLVKQRTDSFHRFSDIHTGAHFIKVDVDEVPDVAQELGVRAMPTFMIFKDGQKVQEVVGANPDALQAAIEEAVKEE